MTIELSVRQILPHTKAQPELLDQIISNKWKQDVERRKTLCSTSCRKARETNGLTKSENDLIRFCEKYNPTEQVKIAVKPWNCYFGNYPTLEGLNKLFDNDNAASVWLIPQLNNLSEFCGAREKLQGAPIKELASIIAYKYRHYKVTELMLFFYRFKTGKYGRFYGVIDPIIIMEGLHKFEDERNYAYQEHQWDLEAAQRQKDHEAHVRRLEEKEKKDNG